MFFTKKSVLSVFFALILGLSMVSPASATEVTPRASDYLMSYSAYVYPAGWYKVQVWVSVNGVDYMDEIGALTIELYESRDQETWTWVDTFHYLDYPDMLGYNDHYHSGHVEYAGSIGCYYKAYVSIWAGKDGDGDNRHFWTSPKKATLFAATSG
jgi:hypothetical protein